MAARRMPTGHLTSCSLERRADVLLTEVKNGEWLSGTSYTCGPVVLHRHRHPSALVPNSRTAPFTHADLASSTSVER